MLGVVFRRDEIKRLIRNDRTARSTSYVVPLQIIVLPTGKVCPTGALIAEEVISFTVDLVAPAAAHDVDRARRGDRRGDIQVRLSYLELLDGGLRDILRRGSDVLVGNIETIEFNGSS